MKESIINLFLRDLDKLQEEISSYKDDASIWKIKFEIKNSGGNLALHLIGNLNHFLGAILGNSGYIRLRENEFTNKNINREEIIVQINELKITVKKVLSSLTKQDLEKAYPINVFGNEMKTEYFLIHLFGHLNYHLGQINYHRRLLDKC